MIKHRYAHEIDPNGGSAAAVLARMVEPGQLVMPNTPLLRVVDLTERMAQSGPDWYAR